MNIVVWWYMKEKVLTMNKKSTCFASKTMIGIIPPANLKKFSVVLGFHYSLGLTWDLFFDGRGALFLEVMQYQVKGWSGQSKLLVHLPAPKMHLIYCPQIKDISDIKLRRTDTTLDLS